VTAPGAPVPAFDRDLDRAALRRVVGDLAARPELWRPLVTLDAERRRFEQLWRDEHLDVWVISWMQGHDTGFHDHDVSQGAVAVVAGAILEERLVLGGPPVARRHAAGTVFDFDASHVHRMRQDSDGSAVSIHAYSPPLWRMGTYAVGPDGSLRRASVSYAEELRPVDAAA
jgi:predicted metal-dependent enzyme (double-stranded beta helix superfamily)